MQLKSTLGKVGNTVLKAIVDTVTGKWLSTRFFRRYWKLILPAAVLLFIYITNRFEIALDMERIENLNKELQIVRSECIREKSRYISNIREKKMQERILSKGLNLQRRTRPPYILKIEDQQ